MRSLFKSMVDVAGLQDLTDELHRATGMPSAIISTDGEVLTSSGWHHICADLHRCHPGIERLCSESDTCLEHEIVAGETFAVHVCPMGLVDASAPVVIDGEHVANVFSGQIFTAPPGEPVEERFRRQVRRSGLDEAHVTAAFRAVPVVPVERFRGALRLLSRLARLVADIGIARRRELESADRSRLALLSLAEDQRAAAQALRASEEKQRLLLEHAGVGIGYYDLDGTTVVLNRKAAAHLGGTPADFAGKPAAEVLGAEWGSVVGERIQAVIATGHPLEFEDEVALPTGTKWFLSTYAAIPGGSGRPAGVQVVSHEISDRKLMEHALRASETRYRELVENLNDVVFQVGLDGALEYVSPAVTARFGYHPDEIIGRPFTEIIFPADRQRLQAAFQTVLSGQLEPREFRLLDRSGNPRWVRSSSRPMLRGGAIAGLQGVLTDITEHRLAELALRASEEKYRNLFTAMAEGFALHEILCDERGVPVDYRFLDANPRFFELTGLPPEIIGRTVREVLPATEDFWIETYGRVAQSGEPTQFEHFSAAIGSRFEVRAFSPRPGQFATVFLDVSERRKAEIARVSLLREVRGLAARLAAAEDAERKELARELHDRVGQSLTALGLNLSALRSRLPRSSRSELEPRLDDAERLLRATAGEVRDVMAELRPPMLDEYGLVAAVRWLGEQFQGRSGIAVTMAGVEPEPRFGPDTEMTLFRIAQEALTNVAKHAQATTVAIEVTPTPAGGRLTIADNGIGFDPAAARASAGGKRTWGLLIMQERAASIGATCTLTTGRGAGSVVTIEITRPSE